MIKKNSASLYSLTVQFTITDYFGKFHILLHASHIRSHLEMLNWNCFVIVDFGTKPIILFIHLFFILVLSKKKMYTGKCLRMQFACMHVNEFCIQYVHAHIGNVSCLVVRSLICITIGHIKLKGQTDKAS